MSKGRQQRIEGTEPMTFPDVNEAAEHYLDAREKKKQASDFAKDAEDSLVSKMRKRSLLTYKDAERGLVVELDTKDKVKVKKIKGAEE